MSFKPEFINKYVRLDNLGLVNTHVNSYTKTKVSYDSWHAKSICKIHMPDNIHDIKNEKNRSVHMGQMGN